jgi:tight adherence protein B
MLPVILTICLGISATAVLIALTVGTGKLKRVNLRLASLDRNFLDSGDMVADIRREERKLSPIPWLNNWLTRMNLGPSTSLFLYQAGVSLSVGALLLISLSGTAILGFLVYWRFQSVLPALILSAGFLPLPFFCVRAKRAQRLSKLEQQIPEALGMIVSALRVGHSLIASLGSVAQDCSDPIGGEIRRCFEEQNFGVDLRTALMNLIARAPVQDLRIFVAAVLIQKDSGGNLAEVLEKVARTTRERFMLRMQVRVHTTQGRMTGWVLSLLPVALGVGMYLMNPEGTSVLWKHPLGLKLLYAATGMDAVGALVIRRIVGIRV